MDLRMRHRSLDVIECECGLSFHVVPMGVTYHQVALHDIHLALAHVVIKLC